MRSDNLTVRRHRYLMLYEFIAKEGLPPSYSDNSTYEMEKIFKRII